MKELNTCIISLGSNYNKETQIQTASERLTGFFTDIRFSDPVTTPPLPPSESKIPYLNRVAIARTAESRQTVSIFLKKTEKELGRKEEDKLSPHMPIDLDLICWNETILKPDDWQRYYVQEGIEEIKVKSEE